MYSILKSGQIKMVNAVDFADLLDFQLDLQVHHMDLKHIQVASLQ